MEKLKKSYRISEALLKRVNNYLSHIGGNFQSLVGVALDEFLKNKGF